jgi:CubicO group peptidase (beta-lactamase class C family)
VNQRPAAERLRPTMPINADTKNSPVIGGVRLRNDMKKPFADISADLAGMIADTEFPSLAAAAISHGQLVAAGASGVRKRGSTAQVTMQDKYHIGSCGKSMTATLAAILVSEGKIAWQTTLAEAFSDLSIHDDYKAVTLHQLLSHSAGCPGEESWEELRLLRGAPESQRRQLAEDTLRMPAQHPPGTTYQYANIGYAVAGAMLESVSGTPYEELLRDKLFAPLSMRSAGFHAPATNGRIDQPYGHNPAPVDPQPGGDCPVALVPAGDIHCSILDFARYVGFHLGSRAGAVLGKDELAFLHRPASPDGGYALGWCVLERPWANGSALTHAGSDGTFYSVMWLAPKIDFGVVAVCNMDAEESLPKCDEACAFLGIRYLKQQEANQ